VDELEQKM
jgi:hypothetical protein